MSRSERALTRSLQEWFAGDPARVPVGIGDDAAVLCYPAAEGVVCCDPVVEGVHFEPEAPLRSVGRKAVNRNFSDLAAMGARPDFVLASVLLSASATEGRRRRALFAGIRDATESVGALVVGGDIGATPGPLTVTVTALGHLEGRALRRDQARVGDRLHVSGPLGGAILGRHLRFVPRLDEGCWLGRHSPVRAAIDVSDGLVMDLWTMLEASAVPGALLFEEAIPLHSAARRLASRSGRSALEHALGDGEDHELLFALGADETLPAGGPLDPVARVAIGELRDRPGIWLRQRDGRERRLAVEGFQHDV